MSAAELLKRHQKGVKRQVEEDGECRELACLVTCTGGAVLVAAFPFATKQNALPQKRLKLTSCCAAKKELQSE